MTEERSEWIDTTLNYVASGVERYEVYTYPAPSGQPQFTTEIEKFDTRVYDGRRIRPSLDREGVTLAKHETSVSELYDADRVRSDYYPEIEELVRKATGAAKVIAFDHNLRNAPLAKRGEGEVQSPVRFVHNDYTEKSGPQRVRDLLEADEARSRLERRFAVINVWKPIAGPVQESPLGVCDALTLRSPDLIPTDLVYRDRRGEIYSVQHNPEHRWIYFPLMRDDEAMLLKCYDSARDGRSRFTAHSAIVDPTSPPDAPARQSVEVRTMAFFDAA